MILSLLFALPQLFFSDYIPDKQYIFYAVTAHSDVFFVQDMDTIFP